MERTPIQFPFPLPLEGRTGVSERARAMKRSTAGMLRGGEREISTPSKAPRATQTGALPAGKGIDMVCSKRPFNPPPPSPKGRTGVAEHARDEALDGRSEDSVGVGEEGVEGGGVEQPRDALQRQRHREDVARLGAAGAHEGQRPADEGGQHANHLRRRASRVFERGGWRRGGKGQGGHSLGSGAPALRASRHCW